MSGEHGLPHPENLAALPEDGGPKYNRLIFEQSPYLLQHAENPVDWYPWGEAAFAKAEAENKPIFLSIGYATCHWCHVMAHESFEDGEVAELLNRHFVSIKVDKEERPDVDEIYMTACLALNGHGGWPLTALLMPDQRPFFAATYLPKASRGGRMGMLEFVPRIARFWAEEPQAMLQNASRLTETIRQYSQAAKGELGTEALENAYRQLVGQLDPNYGGFGRSPKFPTAHHSLFLLRSSQHPWGEHALDAVQLTLNAMRHGGLFDHLGYGFHRYSTDQVWLLPHFEKMLYDQAMLAIVYLEAFSATREPLFAQTAREIFAYVLRDMTDPEGGFYSAEDADSEGEEGKFYVWAEKEILDHLGQDLGRQFNQIYQVETRGNFREEATGHFIGTSILHLPFDADAGNPLQEYQDACGLRPLEEACKKLFVEREKRIHPLKDDKVLTDWNGLMIAAFSIGARVLGEASYLKAAQKAAGFVSTHLTLDEGVLLKRYRQGSAGLPAHLDDYAFFAWGNLELFRSSGESRYLKKVLELITSAKKRFLGEALGAFYHTAADGETLIARSMKAHDGAIPSGNSVMAYVLAVLGRLTGHSVWEEDARRVLDAFAGQLNAQPQSSSFMMMAFDFLESTTQEVIVVGENNSETQAFIAAAREGFHPNRLVIWKKPDDPSLGEIMPFVKEMTLKNGKTTAYLCENYTCEQPLNDLTAFKARLKQNH